VSQDLVLSPCRRGQDEPPAQFPSAGRRHAVEVAARAAAGPEDLQMHPARPAEAGERRIDLREIGPPDVIEVLADGALELVTGSRFFREQTQEHVRE